MSCIYIYIKTYPVEKWREIIRWVLNNGGLVRKNVLKSGGEYKKDVINREIKGC